ncbi:helix-turn-helix domain-containing protein [Falsiroseomonas sp.]|uniref:helix-turn-helix domain-containing protein n=1 Tax=Falsiroseomonas sp. TaxID=2870721 RepID=UPI0027162056|nr:helix-turn-helix domain-containing protein [Falsiroseomonas sp.]MDO9502153.1 helix-turn-helix domain-containing protein [Falsiroseomonas sp.]
MNPTSSPPEAVPLPKAHAIFGLSRSTLYRLAAAEKIRLFKVGRATLVDAASVRAFLAAAPAAEVRQRRRRAA